MIQIAKAKGRAPIYKLDIQDIISVFNGSPHRMIKMIISGENFPIRNAPIFVRVRNGKKLEDSLMVELSANANKIIASFPVDFTRGGDVEFGYGDEIFGVFKNSKWESLKMLNTRLIDKEVIVVNKKWIKKELAKSKKITAEKNIKNLKKFK